MTVTQTKAFKPSKQDLQLGTPCITLLERWGLLNKKYFWGSKMIKLPVYQNRKNPREMSQENRLILLNEKMQISFTTKTSRFLNLCFWNLLVKESSKAAERGTDFNCNSGNCRIVRIYQDAFLIFFLDLKRWLLAVYFNQREQICGTTLKIYFTVSFNPPEKKKEKLITQMHTIHKHWKEEPLCFSSSNINHRPQNAVKSIDWQRVIEKP